jgi:manganese/zinc/iron transport system permease protein
MMTFLILATAGLLAFQAALGGSFLLLRRSAMLTDAMAHSVLPGLVIGYLFSGSRSGPEVILFAAASSFFSAYLIDYLNKFAGIWFEASTGFVFTSLFAIGIVLITTLGGNVDLDADCVLYGELLYVPFRYSSTHSWYDALPLPLWNQIWVGLAWALFLFFRWKQLKTWAFDAEFCRHAGISDHVIRRLVLALTSMSIVVGFDAFGAILVVGFFILPAATAWLISRTWHAMILISLLVGLGSTGLGYSLALFFDWEPGPSIVSVAGLFFLAAAFAFRQNRANSTFRPTH